MQSEKHNMNFSRFVLNCANADYESVQIGNVSVERMSPGHSEVQTKYDEGVLC